MSTTAVQSGTVHGLDLSVSANNPCPRSVRAHRRGHKLSASANASQFRQSVGKHWQRTQTVRRQSAVSHSPSRRTRLGRAFAVTLGWQEIVHAIVFWFPYRRLHVSRSVSDLFSPFPPMSSFDPTTVRKAVEEFTPIRPQKFQDLFPATEAGILSSHRRLAHEALPAHEQ